MNSNAQEYRLFGLQSLMYRTLGGVLDFYIFSGPNPESVIQQYANLIGTPFMPPYYALGFQLSRYGYNNIGTLRAAIDRTLAANIPFDIQHGKKSNWICKLSPFNDTFFLFN
jgi:alpha-glucosidase (family GH31 glycosyl hydrolase)